MGIPKRIETTKSEDSAGILVEKLSVAALDQTISMVEWEAADGDEHGDAPESKAVAIHVFMTRGEAEGSWNCLRCPECDGIADEDWPFCPYCGSELDEWLEEQKSKAGKKAKGAKTPKFDEDEGDGEESSEPDGDDDEGPNDIVATAMATTAPSFLAGGAPAASQKLVKLERSPDKMTKVTVKDLDAAVAKVVESKGKAGLAYYDLGLTIRDIKDRMLWKLRTRAGGEQMYRNWEQFCASELKMIPQSALNAIDLTRNITREMAEKYGRSKMTFLVRAHTDDEKKEVLAAIEGGASKRQLAAAEKDRNAKKRAVGEKVTGPWSSGRPEDKNEDGTPRMVSKTLPASTRPPKQKPTQVTAVLVPDKEYDLAFFERPRTGSIVEAFSGESPLAPAKSPRDFSETIIAEAELVNGITAYVSVWVNADGRVRGKLIFAREEETKTGT